MKRLMMAMVTLAAVLFVAAGVQADTSVNWATAGAYIEKVGNNGLFGPEYPWNEVQTNCDKVTLADATGSLTLVPGVPQVVAINPLTFEIGQTGAQPNESYTLTTNFSMARNITINGVTKSLVSPMTHVVTWYTDSLQVRAGAPVVFGNIIVTPLGWNTAFSNGVGVYNQTVYAEFLLSDVVTLVPEALVVCKDSTVNVSVDMTLLSPITMAAISTNILYNPNVFTFDDMSVVVQGDLLTHTWDLSGGTSPLGDLIDLRVGGIIFEEPWYDNIAAGSGTLLTFTLKVKADAPLGPSALTWGVYDGFDNATAGFDYGDKDGLDVILPESALTGTTITVEECTVITLSSFEAKPGSNKVTLTWETATEIDNAGFNILRAESADGEYIKINDSIIPAKAGAAGGASYQFTDSTVKNRTTYYYKLQDIGLSGSTTDHGPKSATPRLIFGFGK